MLANVLNRCKGNGHGPATEFGLIFYGLRGLQNGIDKPLKQHIYASLCLCKFYSRLYLSYYFVVSQDLRIQPGAHVKKMLNRFVAIFYICQLLKQFFPAGRV